MFFVFEGIDGSGKSTQARLLRERLVFAGRDVLLVREPGGTRLGERLRELLLDPLGEELSAETELFLFMAARAHLCRTVIVPALAAGRIVISDRFIWSSAVYQGFAGGLEADEVLRIGRIATRGLEPARSFLIDLEPEAAFARIEAHDRLERRGLGFQERVRDGFLVLARRYPESLTLIDGRGDPEVVHGRVLVALPAELRAAAGGSGRSP
jgi:dTMP kinase